MACCLIAGGCEPGLLVLEQHTNRRIWNPLIGLDIDLPSGTRLVVLGIIMAAVLLFRPSGLTGGRELTWPFARRGRFAPGG